MSPGQAFLSLGTSGVLFVVTDRFRPNPERAAHAFCHCLPGRWHQMSVMLSAASVLDWVAQLDRATRSAAARRPAPRPGLESPVAFFPAVPIGERTPHNDPQRPWRFLRHPAGHDCGGSHRRGARGRGVRVRRRTGCVGGKGRRDHGERHHRHRRRRALALLGSSCSPRPCTADDLSRGWRSRGGAGRGAPGASRARRGGRRRSALAPPVERVVQPDAALAALLASRRRTFVRLYQDLKSTFVEYSA